MQQPRESSLLFSLAELQRMEEERQVEERAVDLAKAAAENAEAMQKQEAKAAAQRLSDERISEMLALRQQVQRTKAESQERHVELLTLREYRRLSEIPEPEAPLVSTVEFPQTLSRTSHMWWAATVVAACAGVYMLVGNSEQKEGRASSSPVAINVAPPPSAQPVVAEAMPCTEVAIVSAPAQETAQNTEHKEVTRNGGAKGKRPGKGTKSGPRGGKKDPIGDELPATPKHCIGSTNPLCGIDDL